VHCDAVPASPLSPVARSIARPALSDAEIHALFGPSEDGMMRRVLPDRWPAAPDLYFDEYARLLPTCPDLAPEIVVHAGRRAPGVAGGVAPPSIGPRAAYTTAITKLTRTG